MLQTRPQYLFFEGENITKSLQSYHNLWPGRNPANTNLIESLYQSSTFSSSSLPSLLDRLEYSDRLMFAGSPAVDSSLKYRIKLEIRSCFLELSTRYSTDWSTGSPSGLHPEIMFSTACPALSIVQRRKKRMLV